MLNGAKVVYVIFVLRSMSCLLLINVPHMPAAAMEMFWMLVSCSCNLAFALFAEYGEGVLARAVTCVQQHCLFRHAAKRDLQNQFADGKSCRFGEGMPRKETCRI